MWYWVLLATGKRVPPCFVLAGELNLSALIRSKRILCIFTGFTSSIFRPVSKMFKVVHKIMSFFLFSGKRTDFFLWRGNNLPISCAVLQHLISHRLIWLVYSFLSIDVFELIRFYKTYHWILGQAYKSNLATPRAVRFFHSVSMYARCSRVIPFYVHSMGLWFPGCHHHQPGFPPGSHLHPLH